MVAFLREVHSSTAVGPNSKLIYKLETGNLRYDYLSFHLDDQAYWAVNNPTYYTEDQIADLLGNVRVIADGIVLIDVPAKYFYMAKNFYGHRQTVGRLFIPFFRAEMRDIIAERAYGLTTGDIKNLTVELDVKGFMSLDATLSAMVAPDNRPLGKHFRIQHHSYGATINAGIHKITDLPILGAGKALGALHFDCPRFFEKFKINLGGAELINTPGGFVDYEDSVWARTLFANSRYTQTDYTMIDIMCGRASDLVSLDVSSMVIELDVTSTANGFGIISEVRYDGKNTI